MRRKLLLSLALLVALCALAVAGRGAYRAEQAALRLARAQSLLEASIERAPSLADLRASEARLLCAEASSLVPSEEAARCFELARAVERFGRGQMDAARAALERARGGGGALVAVLEASLDLLEGKRERARATLEPHVGEQGSDPRALLLAAEMERDEGRAERALELAQRALSLAPRAGVAHEQLGLAHELLGDLDGAERALRAAETLDRNAITPLLHLGRVLRDAGRTDEALLAFRSAAARKPDSHEAFVGSGVCRAARGDRLGARADLEHAQSLAPLSAEPLVALGDLDAAEGDREAALRRFRGAVKLDADNAVAFLKLGNACVRARRQTEAVQAYQRAIELAPDLAAAHNGLGAALLELGETRAARAALEKAGRLDPRDPNPFLNLARLREQEGDAAAARAALAEARARDPRVVLASVTGQRASSARRP